MSEDKPIPLKDQAVIFAGVTALLVVPVAIASFAERVFKRNEQERGR